VQEFWKNATETFTKTGLTSVAKGETFDFGGTLGNSFAAGLDAGWLKSVKFDHTKFDTWADVATMTISSAAVRGFIGVLNGKDFSQTANTAFNDGFLKNGIGAKSVLGQIKVMHKETDVQGWGRASYHQLTGTTAPPTPASTTP
jgi:hypothetical protein